MKVAESAVRKPTTGSCRSQKLLQFCLLASVVVGCCVMASPQIPAGKSADNNDASPPSPQTTVQPYDIPFAPVKLTSLPRNLFVDQKNFWTGPLHMNETQWQWAVPLVLVGAGLIAEDTRIENHAPTNPTTISRASTASNAGLDLRV